MSNFIMSRTPFRLSFFGGSTDYPQWYCENPGAVLATSIDKYCYIMLRLLPPFFEHKYRIVWSQIEIPQSINEIRHPSVRECLRYMNIIDGIEIHHASDLPARAGVGTSSAFTVGLLNALYQLIGLNNFASKNKIASDSIHIEQKILKENVGSQDQTIASFGGFNRIDFFTNGIKVTPIVSDRIKELESCLMLFFTGFARTASEIAGEQLDNIKQNKVILKEMYSMVGEGESMFKRERGLNDFGILLGDSWSLKKKLHSNVSTEYIDFLYDKAINAGAIGGKLCGAGGGGFLLLFVEPDKQIKVRESLSSLLYVPFKFENEGSQIILK